MQLMGDSGARYHYRVVRGPAGPGHEDIALVRSSAARGGMSHLIHHEQNDELVLHHRSFRPMLELPALEAYAAQLERTAAHANAGTLGCFVDISTPADDLVRVALYERWFDGDHLRCEELAAKDFESSGDLAVAESAEFLAEVRAWAEKRNDERDASDLEARVAAAARVERAADRAEAAAELAQILKAVDRGR